jgi:hypothetical protein
MPPITAQDWPEGWEIRTMVLGTARSAYGEPSSKFESGMFSCLGDGFGNEGEDLGTKRKVEAEARTLVSSWRGTGVVGCGIGAGCVRIQPVRV